MATIPPPIDLQLRSMLVVSPELELAISHPQRAVRVCSGSSADSALCWRYIVK